MERRPEILHIDDNPGDLELTGLAFEEAGLAVVYRGAADSAEALGSLVARAARGETPPPDLVVLDVNMPRCSGIEVLETFQRDARLRDIPVVILTTSPRPKDQEQCLALGAKAYLVKPSRYDRLVAMAGEIAAFLPSREPRSDQSGA